MNVDATSATQGPKLIAQAHKLCADLAVASPRTYWTDLAATACVAYAAVVLMLLSGTVAVKFGAGMVAVLAIYRGVSFIHEVSHLRPGDVPGFRRGYDLMIGVPFLVPSFMYDGVHNLHHAKSRYGTAADPEYLPLARQTVWHVAAFLAVAILTPVGLLLRFAALAPLSLVFPAVRRVTRERFSALAINPGFRREPLTQGQLRDWNRLETACALWALLFVGATLGGVVSFGSFLAVMLVGSGVGTLNQVRTLAAHHWENEGAEMSAEEQFLDSVTVPPPATLPVLWAPVGLRYHALHHLLPRLPYHSLGVAHARLCELLPETSPYHRASAPSLSAVVSRLFGALARRRAERRSRDLSPAE